MSGALGLSPELWSVLLLGTLLLVCWYVSMRAQARAHHRQLDRRVAGRLGLTALTLLISALVWSREGASSGFVMLLITGSWQLWRASRLPAVPALARSAALQKAPAPLDLHWPAQEGPAPQDAPWPERAAPLRLAPGSAPVQVVAVRRPPAAEPEAPSAAPEAASAPAQIQAPAQVQAPAAAPDEARPGATRSGAASRASSEAPEDAGSKRRRTRSTSGGNGLSKRLTQQVAADLAELTP